MSAVRQCYVSDIMLIRTVQLAAILCFQKNSSSGWESSVEAGCTEYLSYPFPYGSLHHWAFHLRYGWALDKSLLKVLRVWERPQCATT